MKLSDPSRKRIELISNIVIICAAVGFGAVLFRNHILKPPVPTVLKPEPGEVLKIDGENFSSYSRTLVIAIREGCQYCVASVPFYQSLFRQTASVSGTRFLIVLPPGSDRSYPSRLGLKFNDVRLLEFKSLKINATPTLLLLNSNGQISNVWVGELSAAGEQEVLRALGLGSSCCTVESRTSKPLEGKGGLQEIAR